MRDMKAPSTMTSGKISSSLSLSMGPCLSGGLELVPEEIRRVVVVKKVSHSNETSSPSDRRSSRGKMSDSDKLSVLGGPFIVSHARRLGSRIICWTAASDKNEDTVSSSRAGPHRRTAAEAADSIRVLVSSRDHH